MVLKGSSKTNLGGKLYMKTKQFLKGLKANKKSRGKSSRNLSDGESCCTSTGFMQNIDGELGSYPQMYDRGDVGNTSFRHWVHNSDPNLSYGEDTMDTSEVVLVDDMTSQPQSYESQDWLLTLESRYDKFEAATSIDYDQMIEESAEDGIVKNDPLAINIPYLDCRRPPETDSYQMTVNNEVKEERRFWFWKSFSFMDAFSAWRNG
ncbi:hypothetical protein MPTK1_2g03550 [Marchantia polymorpha subsp. ruderalis]|uniref:Uncharacterized protein n=1 Tax=Marchantia polymorpha TaxID=3197 RepID=A0A2R6X7E4_MARPO|nr:hypothetical protein MARPO_0031s0011 [Marchantia polymorpha]BBN00972.1 hypothetical protein Mp_2g03550 [Marchantia polymorpha subsp. ruderalis]|eukprot:PTQ42020.1 hypothetical protein MARPO_0031s0011 [Marchantia polymorpha]